MKKMLFALAVFFVTAFNIFAQVNANNPGLRPIITNFGARNYAAGSITRAELDLIIQAGVRSPSAGNRQPWRFTVVQDNALAKRMISQVTDGNILIAVSAQGDGKTNGAVILDCALAVQSMYLAAQALGLGSRIYTGPVDAINSNFKTELGLPANHNVIAVVRIGRLPANTDAVSSASPRNSTESMVFYK